MTSRSASAAVFARRIIHGHGPIAELYEFFDMVGSPRIRVHFMAGAAGPAFAVFIHVDEMKIFFAVPELGRFIGMQVRESRFIVA